MEKYVKNLPAMAYFMPRDAADGKIRFRIKPGMNKLKVEYIEGFFGFPP